MAKPTPPTRADFAAFRPITTRWMDNDLYGHVNNATYYSFFDTVVSGYLVDEGFITPGRSPIIGLAVASSCSYFSSVAFPDAITGGLRVERIGNTSVTYGVGIFRAEDQSAAALGHFTHVYVDAETHRPVPLPDALRKILTPLLIT